MSWMVAPFRSVMRVGGMEWSSHQLPSLPRWRGASWTSANVTVSVHQEIRRITHSARWLWLSGIHLEGKWAGFPTATADICSPAMAALSQCDLGSALHHEPPEIESGVGSATL